MTLQNPSFMPPQCLLGWAVAPALNTMPPNDMRACFPTAFATACDFKMVVLICSSSESIKHCCGALIFTVSLWSRGLGNQHIRKVFLEYAGGRSQHQEVGATRSTWRTEAISQDHCT